jgi:hypothetical protein
MGPLHLLPLLPIYSAGPILVSQQVLSISSEWPAAFYAAAADIFGWASWFFQQVLPIPSDGPAAFSAASADFFSWARYLFSEGAVDAFGMASCI